MTNTHPSTEIHNLYRELSQGAQEVHLLATIFDAVASATNLSDVLHIIETGIQIGLPSAHWSGVRLMLFDEQHTSMRVFEIQGAGVNRYWDGIRRGTSRAANLLGVSVEFVVGKVEDQPRLLREAIQNQVDGIAIAPLDAAGIEPAIQAAAQAGIPLITYDTPPVAGSAALAYIGTNNVAAGRLAGEAMRRLLPQGGVVGTALALLNAQNIVERLRGFAEGIAGSPIQLLDPVESSYDLALGKQRVQQFLAAHSELAGAFGGSHINGQNWADALTAAGRAEQTKLVCFDMNADNVALLQRGVAQAVIAQREREMGFQSVCLLCQMRVDGVAAARATLPPTGFIDTGVDVVTLERTSWSVALADYTMNSINKSQVNHALRRAIQAHADPIRLQVIGLAEDIKNGVVEAQQPFVAESLVGRVLDSERALVMDLDSPEVAALPDARQAKEDGQRTVVILPLNSSTRVLGVLQVQSAQAQACGARELSLLERIANAVSVVLQNTNLLVELDQRIADLAASARQQEALIATINELSSPVVPIARGVLVLPLVGTLDSRRATRFIETLLETISARQAEVVIIDISGVVVIDTSVANYLMQAARATRLLGAEVVLVGIGAVVAQTLVALGVDMSTLSTYANLESGFAYALSRVGGRIVYD